MNKILSLIFGLFLFNQGFSQGPERPLDATDSNSPCAKTIELVQGVWTYISIEKSTDKGSTAIAGLTSKDTMFILNGRFGYDIEALKKHSRGHYTVNYDSTSKACVLQFDYNQKSPEHVSIRRFFKVETLTAKEMIISEGSLSFVYQRR